MRLYDLRTWISVLVLVVLPLGWGLVRVIRSDFRLERLVPQPAHRVHVRAVVEAEGRDVRVAMYLPQNEDRLALGSRWLNSDMPLYSETYAGGNRRGEWAAGGPGIYHIESAFTAVTSPVRFVIDESLPLPEAADPDAAYLDGTPSIQTGDPRIMELAGDLVPPGTSLAVALRRIHDACRELAPGPSSGDDAVSALLAGPASSVGRSRLFVALARRLGIPARTVTGMVLDASPDWAELTWVEAKVAGQWVPFCATRNAFARLPAGYLPMRRDAPELLVVSEGVRVQRHVEVSGTLDAKGRFAGSLERNGWLGLWSAFEDAGVPMDVVRIIMMIPLGALLLVILRNVVGIQTFGFFLPLLVAVASLRTGLAWGLAGFFALIALLFLVRIPLERQRLLHSPQMAILLTSAVVAMLGLAALGLRSGHVSLGYVTFFPFAILTITTERFAVMVEEEGVLRTAGVVAMTAASIAACHVLLAILPLQALFLGFPELLLPLVFVNVLVGKWMGVRLLEYWRFRRLVVTVARVSHA